jgi:hypothetical protein
MPGVRKDGMKNVNLWVDGKLLERWEKRCCVDIHSRIIPKSMSARLRFLMKEDVKKHSRNLPPKAGWENS